MQSLDGWIIAASDPGAGVRHMRFGGRYTIAKNPPTSSAIGTAPRATRIRMGLICIINPFGVKIVFPLRALIYLTCDYQSGKQFGLSAATPR
jgi:hypothetical protein